MLIIDGDEQLLLVSLVLPNELHQWLHSTVSETLELVFAYRSRKKSVQIKIQSSIITGIRRNLYFLTLDNPVSNTSPLMFSRKSKLTTNM